MVQSALTCINDLVTSSDTGIHLWNEYKILRRKLEQILKLIAELQLPIGKTRLLELTDAGPGVGCNNIAVRYRMAEKILIHGYDKVLRVHRARGDSGQNEAERTNASIGEALVTGQTLDWEYYKRFEGTAKEEIEALSLQEYEQLEENRMKKNAWRAATELAERVDGEPAPSGFLTCNITPNEREQFLWDKGYLEKFISNKSETGRLSIPGHGYYGKLDRYCQIHFKRGELYLEYLKGSCEEAGELCNFCVKWNGPKTDYVPRPYPDYNASGFHYLPGRKTPLRDEEGNLRVVDDFQPRAALKNLHQQDTALTSSDEAGIKDFSGKYIVPENLARNYLQHLEHLELLKEKRHGEHCKVESLRNFVFVDNQKMGGSWYAVIAVMSGFMVTA